MANCENLSNCPFFHDRMAKKNVLAYVYKQRFCKGDNSECARYVALKYLGKGNIPMDLYPNEMAKARQLISKQASENSYVTSTCEFFQSCDLFTSGAGKLPATSKAFQDKFCMLNNTSCARYMVLKNLGRDLVPSDLFPNERGRALNLINVA